MSSESQGEAPSQPETVTPHPHRAGREPPWIVELLGETAGELMGYVVLFLLVVGGLLIVAIYLVWQAPVILVEAAFEVWLASTLLARVLPRAGHEHFTGRQRPRTDARPRPRDHQGVTLSECSQTLITCALYDPWTPFAASCRGDTKQAHPHTRFRPPSRGREAERRETALFRSTAGTSERRR